MHKPRKPSLKSKRRKARSTLRPSSEKSLVRRIMRALRSERDAWIKKRRGDTAASGEPDIERIRYGHVTMLEVKIEGNEQTPLQRRVMLKLQRAGATVAVVHSVEEAVAVADAADESVREEVPLDF